MEGGVVLEGRGEDKMNGGWSSVGGEGGRQNEWRVE